MNFWVHNLLVKNTTPPPGGIKTANLLSRWLKRAHVPHKGGAWGNLQAFKGALPEQINRLSENGSDNNRWLQVIIPDLIISALHLEHLVKGAHERFRDATTLGILKTLAPG